MGLLRAGLQQGVLALRLDRPAQLNALTLALARELLDAVQGASRDELVRVVLLTAEGRAFCAGKDRDEPASSEFVQVLQQFALALMDCPKPVVAAVQGWAIGAGLELLLNCDIVLAGHGARFKLPEVALGLLGTGGIAALLPRQVGLARAKGMLMLGGEFSGVQAQQWGLAWEAVPDEQLQERAQAICAQLAAHPPDVLREIKRSLHDEVVGDLRAVLAREAAAHQRLSS